MLNYWVLFAIVNYSSKSFWYSIATVIRVVTNFFNSHNVAASPISLLAATFGTWQKFKKKLKGFPKWTHLWPQLNRAQSDICIDLSKYSIHTAINSYLTFMFTLNFCSLHRSYNIKISDVSNSITATMILDHLQNLIKWKEIHENFKFRGTAEIYASCIWFTWVLFRFFSRFCLMVLIFLQFYRSQMN